jgi:cysteine-rich repeat protein
MARCGDGIVTNEQCDDGNSVDTDDCTRACRLPVCGDRIVWSGHEACDDGNTVPGDGCSATCRGEVVALVAGGRHTCALSSTKLVKCWGGNDLGQLGLGDWDDRGDGPGELGSSLPAVDFGAGRSVKALFGTGYHHTCAVLDDDSLKCWGGNYFGGLGLEDNEHRGDEPGEMGDALPVVALGAGRHATQVALGFERTCARLDDGSVKCWGVNSVGELGIGDADDRGDDPGEMGDALPAANLGSGRQAIRVGTDGAHSCALLDDASVKCWGYGSLLGLGNLQNLGDEAGEMGDALPALDFGTGRAVKQLFPGATCVLLDDASTKCWGQNEFGGLGLGDSLDRGDDPAEMGDALPALDLGQGRSVVSLADTLYLESFRCALLDDGSVKCWGSNRSGQLGTGDTFARGDAPDEMGEALPPIDFGDGRRALALVKGIAHACALLDDRSVKCWGENVTGTLGIGDTARRGDEPGELGNALPPVDLAF